MVKQTFSTAWKSSTLPRKQRKYRSNAPLHIKQKLMQVHLSKELRVKYGTRKVQARKGDKVRIARGQFSRKEGRIDRVDLLQGLVYISGIEIIKKEGVKVLVPLHPSNLVALELELGDRKRKAKLEALKTKKISFAKAVPGSLATKAKKIKE